MTVERRSIRPMLYSQPETCVSPTGVEPPAPGPVRWNDAGGRLGFSRLHITAGGRSEWRKGPRQWRIAGVGPANSLNRRLCGKGVGAETRVSIHRSKVAWSRKTISIARGETRIFGKQPARTRTMARRFPTPPMTTRSSRDCISSLVHDDLRPPPKPLAFSRVPLTRALADPAADRELRQAAEPRAAMNRPRRLAGRIARQRHRDRSEA